MTNDLQTAITLLRRIVHGEPTRRDHYGYTIATDPYSEARQWLEKMGYRREQEVRRQQAAAMRIWAVNSDARAYVARVRQRYPDVFTRIRYSDIARRRAALMVVLRFEYGLTFQEIGHVLGRDHSTIVHHVARHQQRLQTWTGYQMDYEEIAGMMFEGRKPA